MERTVAEQLLKWLEDEEINHLGRSDSIAALKTLMDLWTKNEPKPQEQQSESVA